MGEPASVSLLGFSVSAASAFGKLLGYFRNARYQTQDRVASYFDQIAGCLREVAERIENGQPPRDTCRRLAVFAAELQSVLKDDYMTPAGDVSINEARLRLAGELRRTLSVWEMQPRDSLAAGVNKLGLNLAMVAIASDFRDKLTENSSEIVLSDRQFGLPSPPNSEIERFENQISHELDERMVRRKDGNIQEIWDAAGEFAALAATLRSRS